MRTTLDINDVIYRRAKALAAKQGIRLRELIESSLRQTLKEAANPPKEKYKLHWEVVRGTEPPPFDVSDRNALYDFFDRDPGK